MRELLNRPLLLELAFNLFSIAALRRGLGRVLDENGRRGDVDEGTASEWGC